MSHFQAKIDTTNRGAIYFVYVTSNTRFVEYKINEPTHIFKSYLFYLMMHSKYSNEVIFGTGNSH